MRDLPGFVETRHQLLTLKSSNRNNWISFAVAHHVSGNHAMAVQVRERESVCVCEREATSC